MSPSIVQKKQRAFFQILLLISLLWGAIFGSRVLQEMESRSWDWRLRILAKFTVPAPDVKIITIDQKSLEFMAEKQSQFWPWPRALYVPIIEYLRRAGARGVAFDILFTEQSHYGRDDDDDFAKSVGRPGLPVVLACASRSEQQREVDIQAKNFQLSQNVLDGKDSFISRYKVPTKSLEGSWALPLPNLRNSAALVADVNVRNDSDGIFRHVQPGRTVRNTPVLTLPFALFEVANPRAHPDLSAERDGQLAVRFAGPAKTYKTYSFAAIVQSYVSLESDEVPMVPLDDFKDAYVFVGMDAPGLLDLRPTPLAPNFPGVEFHATVLDNLIHNTFVATASPVANAFFALCMSAFGAAGILFAKRAITQSLWGAATVLLLFGICAGGALAGWWLEFVPAFICAMGAIIVSATVQYQLEGSQTRFIKRAFKYYVSPEVIEKIISEPTQLTLGGEKRELTIFFCDIAGFTSISEKMDAAILGRFLNTFLSEMTSIILRHNGTVDKYVGDAIVAFWNAPLSVANHELKATQAAVACQEKLDALATMFETQYGVEVGLRIGLHTGSVSVGNFGSEERFNYTVIGDAANLASRLEGANKPFGTRILISDTTAAGAGSNLETVKIATIEVVGRADPISVFTPASELGEDASSIQKAIELFYEKNYDEAEKHFFAVTKAKKLQAMYLKKISHMRDGTDKSTTWKLTDK